MVAASSTLAAALVAAQADMPKVEADAVNPHFKSKFVSLDHLIAKTRPVLNKHGLAIVQSPSHIDGTPALTTTLYHASGETSTSVMPLILGGQDMQKLGAALTYARRYAWAAALGISEQEDDDGNEASKPSPPKSKEADPPPPDTSAVEADLLALVEARGGDVTKTRTSMETARKDPAKYQAWLKAAKAHWEAQKPPFQVPEKAKV